jgi:hypothetical protein
MSATSTVQAAWAVVVTIAEKGPDPADVKPGWLGFGVFLALAVAVVLLWLSLRKQLRKVHFDEGDESDGDGDGAAHPGRPEQRS